MRKTALSLVLAILTTLVTLPEASAQGSAPRLNVREIVTKSCIYYRGEPIENYAPRDMGMINPLIASPVGRMSYLKNFKSGFVNNDYLSVDEAIATINNSPDLDAALDQCYGKNEQAKIGFLMLMNQIQYQAKSDAFFVTVGSFFVQGAVFVKVASKIPFAAGVSVWLKGVGAVKWGARIVLTYSGIVTAKAVYKLIQYKRGKLKQKQLQLPTLAGEERAAAVHEMREEQESLESIKAFAIQDLQSSITSLKGQVGSIKDPRRRAQLVELLRQSEQNLASLKAS